MERPDRQLNKDSGAQMSRFQAQLYELTPVTAQGGVWRGIDSKVYEGDENVENAFVSHGGLLKRCWIRKVDYF